MNILVIFTGGTIGSTITDGFIATDQEKKYKLLQLFQERDEECKVTFDTVNPYTILSENLSGNYLNQLGNCISEHLSSKYDGIILTHGTDTIQYTAAALHYAFPDVSIPIVLVSSQYVLDHPKANGLNNFLAAVAFIREQAGQGIFVSYENADGICYFHEGNKLLPHLPYSDELFSVKNLYFGTIEEGHIKRNAYRNEKPDTDKRLEGLQEEKIKLQMPKKWSSGILRIAPVPGMEYSNFNLEKIRAILLDSYHSGTICSETPGMEKFLLQAKEYGIPVFLTGGNPDGESYESVKKWREQGVITLPIASPIAMYVKLWMVLDTLEILNEKEQSVVKEWMLCSIGRDFVSESIG